VTVAGLPVHALVVHAAVVLIPLTCMLAIGFAVLPGWRWLSRWPAAVAAVVCVGIAFLSTASGHALERQRPALAQLVVVHAQRGQLLAKLTVVLAVVTVVSAVVLPGPSALASGKGAVQPRVARAAWSQWLLRLLPLLPLLLVAAAVVVLVQTVLTGDAGARAVWG
jgi:hypothetical protein